MSLRAWLRRARDVDVLGMNRRNVAHIIPRNPRRLFQLADDKVRAKGVMEAAGVATPKTLCTFESFYELSALEARLEPHHEVVIKPARGAGGRGILVLERGPDGWRTAGGRPMTISQIRRHVGDIVFGVYTLDRPDVALVETRLHPHAFFATLYPRGLSDIRVIVVERQPTLAMIRVPTDASDGKANLHQGGLGLGLDLATGRVTQAWHQGHPIEVHPDTGVPVLGAVVPAWEAIVACAVQVSHAVELRYLGVDLVLSADAQPMVLEFNVRPGLEIQNVTQTPLRKRLAELNIEELA